MLKLKLLINRKQILILIFIASALSIISCNKNDEADILYYKIIDQDADIEISYVEKKINILLPKTVTNAKNLVAEFLLSDGAEALVEGVPQISGKTKNNYEKSFSFKVQSEDRSNLTEWEVTSSNNLFTTPWGLGKFQQLANANNRDYEWYIDQSNTGVHSNINCGPTSTTMAAKWANPAFAKSAEDARAAHRSTGGWWYTSDIDLYLINNSIPHHFISLSANASGTQLTLKSWIDAGNIVILCLDMYYVRPEANATERVDKFYNTSATGWGHFIVVKGYRIVNDQFFYEVYDPNSYSKIYSDGTLKGKNRYYRSSDIFNATSKWWNYAIVISKTGAAKSDIIGLDPATIPDKWGR